MLHLNLQLFCGFEETNESVDRYGLFYSIQGRQERPKEEQHRESFHRGLVPPGAMLTARMSVVGLLAAGFLLSLGVSGNTQILNSDA